MREEIVRMAREAGMREGWDGWTTGDDPNCMYPECVYTENLERFFHMAQAAEREACAKVCDDISAKYKWPDDTAEKVASQWCADRIRARGQA